MYSKEYEREGSAISEWSRVDIYVAFPNWKPLTDTEIKEYGKDALNKIRQLRRMRGEDSEWEM